MKSPTRIVAIAPDPLGKLEDSIPRVKSRTDGQFLITLLSDPDHAVINRYGLQNEQSSSSGRTIPHPTTYVLDKKGVVAWKFTEVNYKIRPTNGFTLAELKKLSGA